MDGMGEEADEAVAAAAALLLLPSAVASLGCVGCCRSLCADLLSSRCLLCSALAALHAAPVVSPQLGKRPSGAMANDAVGGRREMPDSATGAATAAV